jgi:hypothetical protein
MRFLQKKIETWSPAVNHYFQSMKCMWKSITAKGNFLHKKQPAARLWGCTMTTLYTKSSRVEGKDLGSRTMDEEDAKIKIWVFIRFDSIRSNWLLSNGAYRLRCIKWYVQFSFPSRFSQSFVTCVAYVSFSSSILLRTLRYTCGINNRQTTTLICFYVCPVAIPHILI